MPRLLTEWTGTAPRVGETRIVLAWASYGKRLREEKGPRSDGKRTEVRPDASCVRCARRQWRRAAAVSAFQHGNKCLRCLFRCGRAPGRAARHRLTSADLTADCRRKRRPGRSALTRLRCVLRCRNADRDGVPGYAAFQSGCSGYGGRRSLSHDFQEAFYGGYETGPAQLTVQ